MLLQSFANPDEVLEARTQAWSPVTIPEVFGGELPCVLILLSCAGTDQFAPRRLRLHLFDPRQKTNQVELAIAFLDQRRAALHPIATVVICHVAEFADGRAMDVPA